MIVVKYVDLYTDKHSEINSYLTKIISNDYYSYNGKKVGIYTWI